MPRLHLVVPCYNEAARLPAAAFLELVAARSDVVVLFVDDGSTDQTPVVVEDLVRRGNARICALTLPANVGKAGAVQAGIQAALKQSPEFVGYWDADLSTPLAALQEFLDVLDAHPDVDIVMGARVKLLGRSIERHAVRHYFGRVFATAVSLVLQIAVYDTQCGAKVFRVNEPVRRAFSTPFRTSWIFDVEILARYLATTGRASAGSRICELPLRAWTDVPGSKVRPWHAIRAMWDLVRIWQRPGL
jgi:glycosyltransferase involved in cell wall biosynthesis